MKDRGEKLGVLAYFAPQVSNLGGLTPLPPIVDAYDCKVKGKLIIIHFYCVAKECMDKGMFIIRNLYIVGYEYKHCIPKCQY